MLSKRIVCIEARRLPQIWGRQLHEFARNKQNLILNRIVRGSPLTQSVAWNPSQHMPQMSLSVRSMGFYPGPKTPPKKPNFDYSGDLDLSLPSVDKSNPRVELKGCSELENADELTRRLLSLEFAPSKEVMKYRVDEIIKKVQKHELDFTSRGVKIARQTLEIRNGIRHCLEFPKDKVSKGKLINKIQKRRKELKFLRQEDYPLFEKIQEFLNIYYEPVVKHRKPTKRERRVNEVVEKAVALRQQKMDTLRQALEEEKALFEKEKDLLLSEIENELHVIEEEEAKFLDSLDVDEVEEMGASTPLINKPHVGDKL